MIEHFVFFINITKHRKVVKLYKQKIFLENFYVCENDVYIYSTFLIIYIFIKTSCKIGHAWLDDDSKNDILYF